MNKYSLFGWININRGNLIVFEVSHNDYSYGIREGECERRAKEDGK